MRIVIRFLAIFTAFILVLTGYMLWNNNRTTGNPDPRLFESSLDRAVNWMLVNRDQVIQEQNHFLWWMIKQSADLSQDRILIDIFSEYRQKAFGNPAFIWRSLFEPDNRESVPWSNIVHLPDYQQFYIYALTCDKQLAGLDLIQRHQQANLCGPFHLFRTSCVTHQLIGVRFMQTRECGDPVVIASLTNALQQKIVTQLKWDFRVTDVYVQRLLTLVESGARKQVKPIWIKHFLENQLPDGGWSDFHPWLPLGGNRYLGFKAYGEKWRLIRVMKEPKGGFHTTAQAIYLLTLLLH